MAQYRIDKRILSAEEYEEERIGLWALGLFVLGAFIVGHQIYQVIPQEWDKVVRFALILSAAIAGGTIPALFAGHIRIVFIWLLALGIVLATGYWLWGVI